MQRIVETKAREAKMAEAKEEREGAAEKTKNKKNDRSKEDGRRIVNLE